MSKTIYYDLFVKEQYAMATGELCIHAICGVITRTERRPIDAAANK